SGKFFFNAKDGYKVVKIPFAPVTIKRSASAGNMCFNIVDDHGTSYNLGYNTTEITSTPSVPGGVDAENITAWKLENMIGQNRRDTINFAYNNQTGLVTYDKGQTITVEDQENVIAGSPGYANTVPQVSASDTDSG